MSDPVKSFEQAIQNLENTKHKLVGQLQGLNMALEDYEKNLHGAMLGGMLTNYVIQLNKQYEEMEEKHDKVTKEIMKMIVSIDASIEKIRKLQTVCLSNKQ